MREEVDRELAESEKADREKEARRNETEEQEKLEQDEKRRKTVERANCLEKTRVRREARVLPEPDDNEQHQVVRVRHLKLGTIKRKFDPDCSVLAVYDWVGSLCPQPEHFTLETVPSEVVYPDDKVSCITQMLYMREQEDALPLSKDDSRVALGVGGYSHEVSVDDTLSYTGSPENTLSTPDTDMPPFLMEGDDMPGQGNIHDHFATLNAKRRNAVDLLHSVKYVTVKRFVFHDLMEIYKDQDIVNYKLYARFEVETATGDGVLSEMYSLFWETFFGQALPRR